MQTDTFRISWSFGDGWYFLRRGHVPLGCHLLQNFRKRPTLVQTMVIDKRLGLSVIWTILHSHHTEKPEKNWNSQILFKSKMKMINAKKCTVHPFTGVLLDGNSPQKFSHYAFTHSLFLHWWWWRRRWCVKLAAATLLRWYMSFNQHECIAWST